MQDQYNKSKRREEKLKANIAELEEINLTLMDKATQARRDRRKALKSSKRSKGLAESRLSRLRESEAEVKVLAASNYKLEGEKEALEEKLVGYDSIIKECKKIKDGDSPVDGPIVT